MTKTILFAFLLLASPAISQVEIGNADPFARGVSDRAAGFGFRRVAPPDTSDSTRQALHELYNVDMYRIAAIVAHAGDMDVIATPAAASSGDVPHLDYVRLGQFAAPMEAKQKATDLARSHAELLDAQFILRPVDKKIALDVGPLRSRAHAHAYCHLLRQHAATQIALCAPVRALPVGERHDTFRSMAAITPAPKLGVAAVPGTSSALLAEGDRLGVERAIVTKITPCLLYTSPSPRDATLSRMPSSA